MAVTAFLVFLAIAVAAAALSANAERRRSPNDPGEPPFSTD